MKRVLLIKLFALGDMLMATPMIAALKAKYPEVEITWIADVKTASLLEGHPDIAELFVLDSGRWRRQFRHGNLLGWLKTSHGLYTQLRSRNFDSVINCHAEKWWSLILCAAPIRVGLFSTFKMFDNRRFYTHSITRPKNLHTTRYHLLATQALGCADASLQMSIGETEDEAAFIDDFFRRNTLDKNRLFITLSPFATSENRSLEPETYAALGDWLQTTYTAKLILTFTARDSHRAQAILDRARIPMISAKGTTLRQYVALLRRADLAVCVDSSAMHICGALGTPFVALFGPTPLDELAPLIGKGLPIAHYDGLECAPCNSANCRNPVFRACMKQITLETIQTAIRGKLAEQNIFPHTENKK